MRDIPKGWRCPGCGAGVRYDEMLKLGCEVSDAGRWWVKGRCSACGRWIQFTKSGALVLDEPSYRRPGPAGRYPIVIKRGRPR